MNKGYYETTLARMHKMQYRDLIQEEARIANELQRDHIDITRSEALRLAAEFLKRDPR